MDGMVLPPGQKPQAGVALSQDSACMLVNDHNFPCLVPVSILSLSGGNLFADCTQRWPHWEMSLLAGSIAGCHRCPPLDFHENLSL